MNTAEQAYVIKGAEPADEAEIRHLLRQTPMRGAVNVSLQREPDANIAAAIEGEKHHTVLILNSNADRVLGMGSRSVRKCYINGEVKKIGYLGQLRSEPGRKGIKRLAAGFKAINNTRETDELPFDLTSIISDNENAVRLLEKGFKGIPKYEFLTELSTFIIPTRFAKDDPKIAVEEGSEKEISSIVESLQRYSKQYQFAPFWDKKTITDNAKCRGLTPNDFYFIRSGNEVGSCMAIWDQRSYKQIAIHGYTGMLALCRPVLNLYLKLAGKPVFPSAPCELKMAYLSHMAINNNSIDNFTALMTKVRHEGKKRGLDYLMISLCNDHELFHVLKSQIPNYEYKSNLYTVHWNGEKLDQEIGRRIPYVEAAVL